MIHWSTPIKLKGENRTDLNSSIPLHAGLDAIQSATDYQKFSIE